MERDTAARIDSILIELAKDCDELAIESARDKLNRDRTNGFQQGISKVRGLAEALQSLHQLLSGQ
jgi:hypothetical protein